MTFQPLNKHVEIRPITQKTLVQTGNDSYEEKGTVLSVAEGVTGVKVGDIAYFDSWLCAKYEDQGGEMRYLVPEESIRAVEC